MDCSFVRASMPAYLSGDLDAADSLTTGAHLAECVACMAEARDTQFAFSLLKSLPEIAPSANTWSALSDTIDLEPARRKPALATRTFLKLSAAASMLVAALSFLAVGVATRAVPAATVSYVMPGSEVRPGAVIRSGEAFTAPAYLTLTLPEVGTLKLDKGSTIRFETARRVRLEAGELFAEITPDGRGFVVAAADAGVTVHGTRFGVKSDAGRSTVYVLEGRVAVETKTGTTELTDRQMAPVGGPPKGLDDEVLRWIAEGEAPLVVLSIESPPIRIRKGAELPFRLAFRSTSPAPVLLDPLRDLASHLVLKVVDPAGKEFVAGLEGRVTPLRVQQGTASRIRVDVSSPCLLECRADLGRGFERSGRYTLSLSYQGDRTPGSFRSVVESDPVTVEVGE